MKRGQVTAFIIIGIVLLILVGVTIYLVRGPAGSEIEEGVELSTKAQVVTKFVDSCIDSTVNPGLIKMGMQGGYSQYPLVSLSTVYSDVPYYYYKGVDNVMTVEEIEIQFEDYINEKLPACVAGFVTLNESQYEIVAGQPSADVTINEITGLSVVVNYPLEIKTDNRVEIIDEFSQEYDVRVGTLLDVSEAIVQRVEEDPRMIPTSYLLDLGIENDLQIDTFTYGEDTVIYIIEDENSLAGGIPMLYMFATKMDVDAHVPVVVSESLSAECGREFNYTIKAFDPDGDALAFADDSDLFDIQPSTGQILFRPFFDDICQPGSYPFTINVFDGINEVNVDFDLTVGDQGFQAVVDGTK